MQEILSLSITVRLEHMGITRLQCAREEATWLQAEYSTVVTGHFRVKLGMLNCKWLGGWHLRDRVLLRDGSGWQSFGGWLRFSL